MGINQNPIEDFLENVIDDLSLLFSDPIAFFDTYFFSAPGYNLYNTVAYTLIGICAIFLIAKILQIINKKGVDRWGDDNFIRVQMDNEFFISILPYIFIGSTFRALQDIAKQGKIISPYEFFKDRLFVTPGVYIITILLTIIIGLISIFISQEFLKNVKRFSNWRFTLFIIGSIIEMILIIPIIPLLFSDFNLLVGGLIIILLTGLFSGSFHLSADIFSKRYLPEVPIQKEEKFAMITQMFDAFNTVIAIEFFNYQEKHYLPSILFNTAFGSWPFLLIKFGIVLMFIWAVRGLENKEIERWLLWVVFLLGLATGTRDFLRLITNT
jgi:uncharacterized membrane protein